MLRIPRELEIYRRDAEFGYYPGDQGNGAFYIPVRGLIIIASNGGDWEHVSVSLKDRCPTWDEMEWVKRKLWSDDDTVMQLHVPVSEHKNFHQYCLHLWRPTNQEIPRPPAIMVAP